MKKSLMSYHIFVCSKLERFLLWLIYPIVSLSVIIIMIKHHNTPAAGFMSLLSFVVMLEIPIENYFFNGILSVQEKNMEYLKSTGRVEDIVKGAVTISTMRRLIYYGSLIFIGGWYLVKVTANDTFSFDTGIYVLCSTLLTVETGTYLWARYGRGNDSYSILAGIACSFINAIVFSIFFMAGIWSGFSIFAAVGACIITVVIKSEGVKRVISKHYCD